MHILIAFQHEGMLCLFPFLGNLGRLKFWGAQVPTLHEILTKYNGLVRDVFLLSSLGFCANVK